MDSVSPLRKKLVIYFIGFTAALAGLLFGLDVGVISGALPFLKNDFKLSIEAEGTVVSALLWGAVVGTLVSGMLSSNFGRRKTILISAVIFVVGSILCSISPSELVLIGARLFLGIAVGVASFTAPLYISEISPQNGARLTGFDVSTNDHHWNRACVSKQHLARVLCDVSRDDWRPLAHHARCDCYSCRDHVRGRDLPARKPAMAVLKGFQRSRRGRAQGNAS